MNRAFALALTFMIAACGRDPAQVRWDAAFESALRMSEDDPRAAEARLAKLATTAPRAVDEGFARFEWAHLVLDDNRTLEGANLLLDIAEHARRQDDRARAYYEIARLAELQGRMPAAKTLYRNLVRTYPNLMPGERSLAHLLRIARLEGDCEGSGPAAFAQCIAVVDAHLTWTRSIAETLAHTGLADDLLFQAADESQRRATVTQRPADWARTEALFLRLGNGPQTPLWNDAWWELSWIYHRQGRYREEIAAIERIQRTREEISLFGQNEHPYYYIGQLRIARTYLVELADPHTAIDAYLRYAELFPKTIKKDDVRFFALCAALQAGERDVASDLVALLRSEHADSRYLRRIEPALADPRGPHCLPPEVER